MWHLLSFDDSGSLKLLLHVSHDDKGKTADLKTLFSKKAQKIAKPDFGTKRPTEPIHDLINCWQQPEKAPSHRAGDTKHNRRNLDRPTIIRTTARGQATESFDHQAEPVSLKE
ncbi:hypothetical protein V8C40DRAFT_251890 [Trichoderma camerunense]